jgi:hypothetical protein
MKINFKFCAGLVLATALSIVTVACSSTSSSTTSSTGSTTTTPASTTTTTSIVQRQGSNGTIASINGNILTLTTSQGQVTVNISSSTTIEKTAAGTAGDLNKGDSVTISGTADSSGNISATSITVRPQGQSLPTTGNGGGFAIPNGGFSGVGTNLQFTIGTISGINGNSLTVTTAQSQVTVNISSSTVIQKTENGALSDLQTGVSLTVVGPTDSNGNINATSISIRSQGQGFPTTAGQNQTSSNTSNPTSTATVTTYHVGIYSDAACTESISSLDWGDLSQGTSATKTVYIENSDNQTLTVAASISANATSGITFTDSGPLNMIPGSSGPSVYQLQMSLAASSVATPGGLNFNISFTGGIPVSITSHANIISPLAASTVAQNPTTTSNASTIGIYSDAACTDSISSLDWGALSQATSATQTIYIENLMNQTMTVTASISASATAAGLTLTNTGPLSMVPGSSGPSVYQMQMSLSASSGTTVGGLNFDISFTGATPVSISNHVKIVSASTTPSSTTPSTTSVATLSSIAVTPTVPTNLVSGYLQQFTATGTYSDGSTADITSQVTWASSNPAIATISSAGLAGLATGETAGNTNITAIMSGVTSSPVTLTVIAPTLSSIMIMPAAPTLGGVGATQQFSAAGIYSDGSTADVTSQVTWSSSNPAIATISSTGLVTSVATGTANITATLSGVTGTPITLTVIAPTLSSILITPLSTTLDETSSTQQFMATGTYSDGSTADITSQVTWSSSNPAIATISSTGSATSGTTGTTNITAALSGVTAPAVTLTVVSP